MKNLQKREDQTDDEFLNSMLIGYSSLMGTAYGGNPAGAIIGDALNTSDEQSQKTNIDTPQNEDTPIIPNNNETIQEDTSSPSDSIQNDSLEIDIDNFD